VFRATAGTVPKLGTNEKDCASAFPGMGNERNACTNSANAWTRLCDPLKREIEEIGMSWIFPQCSVFRVQRIALAIGLFLLSVPTSAQQREGGAFSRFAGDWSGAGTVKTSAGTERLRCKAHYDVTSDGTSLEQTLLCASDSYKLEVRSKVAATGTRFAGKWNEVTRDTIGNLSGTITSTGIRGKIDGIGFTADLAISTQANRQSVTIEPSGATEISQVAITLSRI
jgi:hypothetical protein